MLVCDGLKGLPEAVETVWPRTIVQTCVVHLLRNSFRYAARQDWDKVAKALRPVYTAPGEEAATERFLEFQEAWGKKYPETRSLSWGCDVRRIGEAAFVQWAGGLWWSGCACREANHPRGALARFDSAIFAVWRLVVTGSNGAVKRGWAAVHRPLSPIAACLRPCWCRASHRVPPRGRSLRFLPSPH